MELDRLNMEQFQEEEEAEERSQAARTRRAKDVPVLLSHLTFKESKKFVENNSFPIMLKKREREGKKSFEILPPKKPERSKRVWISPSKRRSDEDERAGEREGPVSSAHTAKPPPPITQRWRPSWRPLSLRTRSYVIFETLSFPGCLCLDSKLCCMFTSRIKLRHFRF